MALRIKDNVDLKELEKYGFKRKKYFYESYDYEKSGVLIYEHSKEITTLVNYDIDTLYDLIKADLVEKVE